VLNFSINGPESSVPIRVYRSAGDGPLPVLVYYHGGGFVRGSVDTHDPLCHRIADRSGWMVVSVEYRRPPEYTFPAATEDAYVAAAWMVNNGESIRGDPRRVAVGGDSAGGNLAAAVSLIARERGGPPLDSQLLLYPTMSLVLDKDFHSYTEDAGGFGGTDLEWLQEQYLRTEMDSYNPFVSPVRADDLSGLPPAFLLTCGFDRLRDEGQVFGEQLREHGVPVEEKFYEDMFHPFLNFPELDRTDEAIDDVAAFLNTRTR